MARLVIVCNSGKTCLGHLLVHRLKAAAIIGGNDDSEILKCVLKRS